MSLINRLHSFSIDFNITIRHAFFFSYGMYLSYQIMQSQRIHKKQIKQELIQNRQEIHQKYQQIYAKNNDGALDVTIDNGNWLLSQNLDKVQEIYQQSQSQQLRYNKIMPLYMIAGVGFPVLAMICAYQTNNDNRYYYALSILAISSGLKLIYKL